jgi:hypothetical protein
MLKLKSVKLANPVRCNSTLLSWADEKIHDIYLYSQHAFLPSGAITITHKASGKSVGTSIFNTVEFNYDNELLAGDDSGAEASEQPARRGRSQKSN